MMWIVFLYLFISAVLSEQDEVSRGYVGENVIMEFSKPSKLSFLYHFDKRVAIIQECDCHLFPGTQFAGRLRCSRDKFSTKCTIIIQNVTQRDAGVYKVVREDSVIERRFLNITGTTITSTMNPVTLQGSMTKTQQHQVSTEANYSKPSPVKPNTTITNSMNTGTIDASSAGSQLHSVSSFNQAISLSTQSTAISNNTSTMNKDAPDARSAGTQLQSISTSSQASSLSTQSTASITTDSTMNPVTLQGSMTKTQVHQVSTEVPVKPSRFLVRVSIPDYVIPVVIGVVVGVVMMMIGFLIWMQRRNTYNLDTVQRLILEKCDTVSFSTPTTARRTVLMPALEEGRTDRSVPRVRALHDAILGLYCSATPRNAASVDTLYSSIYSLEKCVVDKPKDDNMFCCNESTERSNTLFSTCDESTEKGILGECPSVCRWVSTLGREEYRKICTVQREVAKNIQALFEKANDEPTISFKYYKNLYAATGNAESLCRNEYQMETISGGIDPKETFQDVKIASSESIKNSSASFLGTSRLRKEFVHGTEEDDGYETFENIKHTKLIQNDKVSKKVKSLTIKDDETKEEKRISDKASNDYEDVDL